MDITASYWQHRLYNHSQSPKGSNERSSVTTKLRQEGHIPSEKSMRRLMQWCETSMDSCTLGRPIIDQRWNNKGGRKRKCKQEECAG